MTTCPHIWLFTIVICGAFLHVKGQKQFYLQHVDSEKYVGKFNGTNHQLVPLVKNVSDAQLLSVALEDKGTLRFTVNSNTAYVDKYWGCADASPNLIYFTRKSDENQLFTVNNDGTIGSLCCKSCLWHPADNDTRVIIKEYNCPQECITRYLFRVLLQSELPK